MSLYLIMFCYCAITAGGSCIDSPDCIENKKAIINPINKNNNKWFQYAVTVALNYEEINKDLQRITNIKPFREEINFLSKKDDWKKLEKNTIAPNVLYAKKKKYILLMFQNITQIVKNKLFF